MNLRRTWAIALGGLGAGLALLGVGLVVSSRGNTAVWAALTENPPPGDVLLSATPLGGDRIAVCLLDTRRGRLMVYLADGKRSRLKLLAVRDISADWALSDYNNDPPLPKDIRQRADKWKETAGDPATLEPPKP